MVDTDVLLEKVNSIQNCLQRIHDTVGKNIEILESLDAQDIVVLNLQRAVQLVINIAFHITSSEKLGLPNSLKDAFRLLQNHKIITPAVAKAMEKMVGFRNIAVHDYQIIDVEILKKIVKEHLKDIEAFYTEASGKFLKIKD